MCLGTRAPVRVRLSRHTVYRARTLHRGIRHSFRFKVSYRTRIEAGTKGLWVHFCSRKRQQQYPQQRIRKHNCLRLASTVVLQCVPVENKNTKRTYTCHSLSNSCTLPPHILRWPAPISPPSVIPLSAKSSLFVSTNQHLRIIVFHCYCYFYDLLVVSNTNSNSIHTVQHTVGVYNIFSSFSALLSSFCFLHVLYDIQQAKWVHCEFTDQYLVFICKPIAFCGLHTIYSAIAYKYYTVLDQEQIDVFSRVGNVR